MITTEQEESIVVPEGPPREVVVRFADSVAGDVRIAGDFNGWVESDHSYDLDINSDGLWETTISLDAGTYEYKVLESDDWDGNDWPGVNQVLVLDEASDVRFVANCGFYTGVRNYDEFVSHAAPSVVGDFMDVMGLGENWTPESASGQMTDIGFGLYQWEAYLPEGDWEYKVVLNNVFHQDTYGNGGNFTVSSNGTDLTSFYYDFRQNSTYYILDESGCSSQGDVNSDGNIDVLDIIVIVSFILDTSGELECADFNQDDIVNVLDVVAAVEFILAGSM